MQLYKICHILCTILTVGFLDIANKQIYRLHINCLALHAYFTGGPT